MLWLQHARPDALAGSKALLLKVPPHTSFAAIHSSLYYVQGTTLLAAQVLALCSHSSAAVRSVIANSGSVLARPALALEAFGAGAAAAGQPETDGGRALRHAELRLPQARSAPRSSQSRVCSLLLPCSVWAICRPFSMAFPPPVSADASESSAASSFHHCSESLHEQELKRQLEAPGASSAVRASVLVAIATVGDAFCPAALDADMRGVLCTGAAGGAPGRRRSLPALRGYRAAHWCAGHALVHALVCGTLLVVQCGTLW